MNLTLPGLGPINPYAAPAGSFGTPAMGGHSFQMQAVMAQMFAVMQMLFREVLGAVGTGAMAPVNSRFGASAPTNGIPNFLGSPSGAGGSPSLSATAPTTDLSQVEGSDFGKRLAAQAEKTARSINTPGLCLKGVNDTMQAMGLPVQREASAYMALDNFRNNPRFKEVQVSRDQLRSLPPGAVVIWDKGSGLPHGHISVALGDGREASSTVRNQLNLKTKFHVFLPR